MPMRKLILIAFTIVLLPVRMALPTEAHDDFHHLGEINKASLVMLAEEDLVSAGLARKIAKGVDKVIDEKSRPGSERSDNYLDFEARLVESAGSEASRLHTGRSRQDMGSTFRRMALREALLEVYEGLLAARFALLELAAEHVDTVIPAYTHGVQAQPTSLAHYLLAFSAAFSLPFFFLAGELEALVFDVVIV